MNELRFALRRHLRRRGFALTVICTLALTTAATTVVLAVINSVLLRPLPFAASDRLMWIASVRPDNPNAPFSLPEFMDYMAGVARDVWIGPTLVTASAAAVIVVVLIAAWVVVRQNLTAPKHAVLGTSRRGYAGPWSFVSSRLLGS